MTCDERKYKEHLNGLRNEYYGLTEILQINISERIKNCSIPPTAIIAHPNTIRKIEDALDATMFNFKRQKDGEIRKYGGIKIYRSEDIKEGEFKVL